MTVILVLLTFLVFVTLDYFLKPAPEIEAAPAALPVRQSECGKGYLTPDHVRYHPGHTWLSRERVHVARVGADGFAAALAGKLDKIELPKPGHWIRQGQKAFALYRNGVKTEMVSPTEGEVLAVNEEVLKNPALLREDPYGRGWLMTINVPDEETTTRNLVPEGIVSAWMRGAAERLYGMQPALAGATSADGGVPVEDPAAAIPGVSWEKLTREFFLS